MTFIGVLALQRQGQALVPQGSFFLNERESTLQHSSVLRTHLSLLCPTQRGAPRGKVATCSLISTGSNNRATMQTSRILSPRPGCSLLCS